MPFMPDTSTYIRMLRAGRELANSPAGANVCRVAVLADHASQQMVHVFRAALAERGINAAVYEGGYASAALEAHDSQSGLYAFTPNIVWLSSCVQKYRERFLAAVDRDDREQLPRVYLNELLGVIDAITAHGIKMVVSNLALPVERQFGNFGLMTNQSLYGSVVAFNALLAEALRVRKGCGVVDVMYLAGRIGTDRFFDERLWISSKYLCADDCLPVLTRTVAGQVATQLGRVTKVIALDLDNTLWGGIIGDDGIDGIALGGDAYGEAFQLFQRYLLSLKARGYVLIVCSKNEEDIARNVFRNHPEMVLREEDIALFVVNWNDKASNLEYAARALNLGLDSFIFIDDSQFERDLVRSAIPAVAVPEMPDDVSGYIDAIETSGLLEATGYSEADAARNQMYREEALRTTEQIKYRSIDDYLKSLDMVINCGPFAEADLPRIAQLLQRSNQFNLRTQRFSEADCARFMHEPSRYVTFQARLRDKFGDYGLISVLCGEVSDRVLEITELVMSCRVLKRGVEDFLMNRVFDVCRQSGLDGVKGEYIRSAKNVIVKDFYQQFGYTLVADDEDRQTWYLSTAQYLERPTFIR